MTVSRLIRIVIAAALTGYVLWQADAASVARAAAAADLRWIALAVALVLVDRSLNAFRWIDLLCALAPGSRPPFPIVLRIFFVSTFIGTFLPGIGGDVYRTYSLARHDVRVSESAASVLMDRMLGVLSMVTVALIALAPASNSVLRGDLLPWLSIPAIACAAVAVVIFSPAAERLAERTIALLPVARLRRAALSLTGAVRRYDNHHAELLRVLLASIGVQCLRIIQAWALGRAVGVELPLVMYCVFIPIIVLIMQLPITVAGLGTSQIAFDRLFVPAGADPAQVVALSMLFLALGWVGNLPGGLLYAFEPRRAHSGGSVNAAGTNPRGR